jgi:glycosyltransferase involved in cell wall biosynthesis
VPEQAEVLVIDDASGDGTHAELARLCAGTAVRLLRNESNLGYAGNVLRLFEECRTPYLLVASDDDAVVTASLAPLARLLEERSPAFVSTDSTAAVAGPGRSSPPSCSRRARTPPASSTTSSVAARRSPRWARGWRAAARPPTSTRR